MQAVTIVQITYAELEQSINTSIERCLSSKTLPNLPETQIITGEDLSKKLGVTIQTLIRWRQKGKIPFLQIGNSIRYDLYKVLDSLEAKKKGVKK